MEKTEGNYYLFSASKIKKKEEEEKYSPYIFWVLATAEPTPPPVTCPFDGYLYFRKIDFSPTRHFHPNKINQIYFPSVEQERIRKFHPQKKETPTKRNEEN